MVLMPNATSICCATAADANMSRTPAVTTRMSFFKCFLSECYRTRVPHELGSGGSPGSGNRNRPPRLGAEQPNRVRSCKPGVQQFDSLYPSLITHGCRCNHPALPQTIPSGAANLIRFVRCGIFFLRCIRVRPRDSTVRAKQCAVYK